MLNIFSLNSRVLLSLFVATVATTVIIQGWDCLLFSYVQGAPKKSNPLGKILFSPNLQRLQKRIQATYPANFIKITLVVQ